MRHPRREFVAARLVRSSKLVQGLLVAAGLVVVCGLAYALFDLAFAEHVQRIKGEVARAWWRRQDAVGNLHPKTRRALLRDAYHHHRSWRSSAYRPSLEEDSHDHETPAPRFTGTATFTRPSFWYAASSSPPIPAPSHAPPPPEASSRMIGTAVSSSFVVMACRWLPGCAERSQLRREDDGDVDSSELARAEPTDGDLAERRDGRHFPWLLQPLDVTAAVDGVDRGGDVTFAALERTVGGGFTSMGGNGSVAAGPWISLLPNAPLGHAVGGHRMEDVCECEQTPGSGEWDASFRMSRMHLVQERCECSIYAHAAQLIELPDGSLMAAWFEGPQEGLPGVAIVVSKLEGDEWQLPRVVARYTGESCQNPVLFYQPETRRLDLLFTRQTGQGFKGQATSKLMRGSVGLAALEGGIKFEPFEQMPGQPGVFIKHQLLRGRNATWLLPLYYTPPGDDGTHFCAIRVLDDATATWTEQNMTQPGQYLAQPSVIHLPGKPPGSLMAFYRDRKGESVFVAFSDDWGESWQPPVRTRFPSMKKSIAALALQSGAIILVFNNEAAGQAALAPLSVALSLDGGKTWPFVRDLETGPGHSGRELDRDPHKHDRRERYTYPSAIETSDGWIHVVYTFNRFAIKHVVISEAWIKASRGTAGLFKHGQDQSVLLHADRCSRGGSSCGAEDGDDAGERKHEAGPRLDSTDELPDALAIQGANM